jgi:hypothetical protein
MQSASASASAAEKLTPLSIPTPSSSSTLSKSNVINPSEQTNGSSSNQTDVNPLYAHTNAATLAAAATLLKKSSKANLGHGFSPADTAKLDTVSDAFVDAKGNGNEDLDIQKGECAMTSLSLIFFFGWTSVTTHTDSVITKGVDCEGSGDKQKVAHRNVLKVDEMRTNDDCTCSACAWI